MVLLSLDIPEQSLSRNIKHTEREVRVRMGEGDETARLPGPALPASSAPSSGRFQSDFRDEKAQRGPKFKEDLISILTHGIQSLYILCGLYTF